MASVYFGPSLKITVEVTVHPDGYCDFSRPYKKITAKVTVHYDNYCDFWGEERYQLMKLKHYIKECLQSVYLRYIISI